MGDEIEQRPDLEALVHDDGVAYAQLYFVGQTASGVYGTVVMGGCLPPGATMRSSLSQEFAAAVSVDGRD